MTNELPPIVKKNPAEALGEKLQAQLQEKLEALFDELTENPRTIKKIQFELVKMISDPQIKTELPSLNEKELIAGTNLCATMKNKEAFIACMKTTLEPIFSLRMKKPTIFEDLEAKSWMES